MYPGVKTWNMLGGECSHKCGYCSTKNLMRFPVMREKYSGPLKLYDAVLKKCPGEDKTIFVVGQNDLFAENVPSEWISTVLERCKAWNNTYFFQTKNPERFSDFMLQFPENTILCTTIETNRIYPQMGNTPPPTKRAIAMSRMSMFERNVTIEPIMDFDLGRLRDLVWMIKPKKVYIGADSKNHHLPEPSKDKVLALIEELEKFTIVEKKTNIARLLK